MLDFVPEKRATAAECLMHPWLQDPDSACRSPATPSRPLVTTNGDAPALHDDDAGAEGSDQLRLGRTSDSDGLKARRSASPERGGGGGEHGQPSVAPSTPAQLPEGEEP